MPRPYFSSFESDYNMNLINSLFQYRRDISKYPVLNSEEINKLFYEFRNNGNMQAKQKIFESNLKLVYSIATKIKSSGMDTLDLIQEGNIGLMRAIDLYDESFDVKFSSYAAIVIKQYIYNGIKNKSRNIRIPNYLAGKFMELKNAYDEIISIGDKEPTMKELLELTSLSEKDINILYPFVNDGFISDGKTLEQLEEENIINLVDGNDSYMDDSLKEYLILLMDKAALSERQMTMILYKFGFLDGNYHKDTEVAEKVGVSRERVNQLEKISLDKIRLSLSPKDLSYFDNISDVINSIKKSVPNTGKTRKFYYSDKTIYNFFRTYSNFEIDAMIDSLSDNDKEVVNQIYNSNIKPDKDSIIYYYFYLVPIMKEILDNNRGNGIILTDNQIFELGNQTLIPYLDMFSFFEITVITMKYGFTDGILKSNDYLSTVLETDIDIINEIIIRFKNLLKEKDYSLILKKTNN